MVKQWFSAALVACLVLVGQARGQDKQEESAEGLKKVVSEALAAAKGGNSAKVSAITKNWVLPESEAWFKKTFGDAKGTALQAEYAPMAATFEQALGQILKQRVDKNQMVVTVFKIESAEDRNATGAQAKAIAAMVNKTPLYTVKMEEEAGKPGFSLWSWAYVDGQFRLIGKLRAVSQ